MPRPPTSTTWGRHFGAPTLLAALAGLVYLAPVAQRALEYDRAAILRGEVWRLMTGHWTHLSLGHLGWDTCVFVLLGVALARQSRKAWWSCLALAPLTISLALFLGAPHWQTYRGLSGVDSALFVALAATAWGRETGKGRALPAAALVLFAAKIAFETATGSTLFTEEVVGSSVVPMAHVVGAATGLLAALLAARRPRRHETDPRTQADPEALHMTREPL